MGLHTLSTRAQVESELARVQHTLGLAEEARRKAKFDHGASQEALAAMEEACKKAEEKLALVIELGTVKYGFAAFREKAVADREMMEAEFDSRGDTLFNYGYSCCAFAHNIRGSKLEIPDGMPNPSVPLTADFFSNPRCPSSASAAASSVDPVVVSGEDRSANSPSAAGKEAVLPRDPPTE